MSTNIERDLRLALAARAAELPSDASTRLLSYNYRPRQPHRRVVLATAATTVTAGAVLAISLIGLSTDAPRAFAGWSATPTTAVGNQIEAAESGCMSRMAAAARIERAEAATPRPASSPPLPVAPADGWRTVLADTRGPYTVILFEASGGRAESSCFTGPTPTLGAIGSSVSAQSPTPVPAGEASVVSSGSNTTPTDEGSKQFSRLVGRTGAGVSGVTLRLSDGSRVTATCANGWFLAWWPGTQPAVAVEVMTPAGTNLRQLTGAPAIAARRGRTGAHRRS